MGKKSKRRPVSASVTSHFPNAKKPTARRLGGQRQPRSMVSVFSTLGPALVMQILLGSLGMMALGMIVWIVFFGPVPELERLPDHGFETRDVLLMFAAWVGLMSLTGLGWKIALHEVRVWGRKPVQIVWNALLVLFNVVGILVVVDVFGLRLSGQNWSALGLKPLSLAWIFGSVGLGILGMVLSGAVAALVHHLQGDWTNPQDRFISPEQSTIPSTGPGDLPEEEPASAEKTPPDPRTRRLSILGALAMLVLVGMLVPLVEEMLFRGVLYTYFTEHFPVWVAVLLSAIAFGVAHASSGRPVVAATAVMGVILALAFHWSHSLWAPVIVHAVNNLTKLVLTYAVLRE